MDITKENFKYIKYQASRHARNREDADELASIAVESLLTKTPRSALKGYIQTTVRNVSYNYYGRGFYKNTTCVADFWSSLDVPQHSPTYETYTPLYLAVSKLPTKQRLVMELYLKGNTYTDMVDLLDMSYASIRSNGRHGMRTLKSKLQKQYGDQDVK